MSVLQNFFNKHPQLATEMLHRSANMWMISDANGAVYWANQAFLEFIGYSLHEFTRAHNPVTWMDITLKDDSLDADIAQAQAAHRGDFASYTLRKFYIPKASAPVFCELWVRRYPPDLSQNCDLFIVEVVQLANGNAKMALSYEQLATSLNDRITELGHHMEALSSTSLNGLVNWLSARPKIGVIVLLVLLTLLFGNRVIEIMQLVFSIWGGPPSINPQS